MRGEREQSSKHKSDRKARGQGDDHVDMEMGDGQTCRVRAESEKGRLGQVYLSKVPHGHIEADQQNTARAPAP